MATGAAARRSSRASPDGPRSRCACRPAAPNRARTASSRRRAARRAACRSTDVLREVERVAAAGFKEIALTGVHLGSYGRDLRAAVVRLIELLRDAATDVRSASRMTIRTLLFRISSLEPMDCTPDVVDLVADSTASRRTSTCRCSTPATGCWRRCGGRTRSTYYAALVERIRAQMPHASIGSDIIVGFPGETDEDFEQLAAYLERSPLTHLHVFPYSDRPGTAASAMAERVPRSRHPGARAPRARDRSATVRAFRRRRSGPCIAR